jgi:hypothetical protein
MKKKVEGVKIRQEPSIISGICIFFRDTTNTKNEGVMTNIR